jgi:hypothetical protein
MSMCIMCNFSAVVISGSLPAWTLQDQDHCMCSEGQH